jgi:hypothetical protein
MLYAAELSTDVWTPTPAPFWAHHPVLLLRTIGLLHVSNGSAKCENPTTRFYVGAYFRGCSHFFMFRLQSLLATLIVRTLRFPPGAPVAFTSEHTPLLLPVMVPDILSVQTGQLTEEDFHLISSAAFSAASANDKLTCENAMTCRTPNLSLHRTTLKIPRL